MAENAKPPLMQLVITWNGPGMPVSVTGPIDDRTLSYPMLEMARDAIFERYLESKKRMVVPQVHVDARL